MRKFIQALVLFLFLTKTSFCQGLFLPGSMLSLKDCQTLALQNNPKILSAKEKVKAALSKFQASQGDYWPQIAFETDYIRGNFINQIGPASSLLVGTFTLYFSQFTGNWILEDFGRRYSSESEAYSGLAEAQALYRQTRSNLLFFVAQAYYKLVEANALLKVREDALKAASEHLKLAQGFVETGEASKLALAEAEVVYSNAQYNLLEAKNNLQSAQENLSKVMGISNPPTYKIQETFEEEPLALNLMQARALALEMRPELQAEKARIEQAKAKLNHKRSERWPVLSANGGMGWLAPTFPPGTRIWTVGLALQWSLFDGFRRSHEIQSAEFTEKSLENEEKNIEIEVLTEVDEAFRNLNNAKARFQAAKDEENAAQENEALAMARYKAGLSSPVELADAEAKLTQAEADKVKAQADLQMAQAALKRAIGFDSF